MVLRQSVRISLLLGAAGLVACSTLPRSLTVRTGEASTFSLLSRRGPKLTLRNDSSRPAELVYSQASDQMCKVVPDSELQALLDVFTAEKLFELSMEHIPAKARDVLQLQHNGKIWYWARRGSFTDPREAAFNKARAYFLSLYNGSTAYHSDPNSKDGQYPSFLTAEEQARRAAELRKLKENRGATKPPVRKQQ